MLELAIGQCRHHRGGFEVRRLFIALAAVGRSLKQGA